MAETKKIIISLPNSLLEEVDDLVSIEEENRSEFIREAMKLYLRERKKIQVKESMKKGYLEMSQINVSLSEMGLAEDIRELCIYETTLTGCEKL
ncbi:CopG-like DNA-binding domain-containing protein [Gottschalkia acidurici 9a]|uniref:CopG-like DNA-binding domain-containing protein n=1 Tax=Gottschalkia acidurici (strain ATCC 7906 / DSM 604 / BCRC 14475 / CIP 104303 / KCTC 5404 / NCIMB 10678 / 9a) TaxID=1128398 RepID=K0B2C6_GOTA9|nr:ribbon-helix-helix protein, CopG family [Gottschalkia acidurici]AFS79085.1 CopG-like DNA-binding domain-containing protein [Gottschalkia acidurici 9a]